MKILYIATSFPEPEKGATIYTDLAETLCESGHEITVAVSEQKRNKQQTEMKEERGFEVLRIVTGNYYDVGFIEKGITTLRLPSLMKKDINKYIGNREFDFILFESPPTTNASLVEWAKDKFQCPAYLMLKDIFPQNAVDLGIIKSKSILYNFFLAKEKKLYEVADIIGCMSEANRRYIIENNPAIDEGKLEIFPNTKKITQDIKTNGAPMRKRYGIPEKAIVYLFGGNMGKPQYVQLLSAAIKSLKYDDNIFFLFVGRGTERYKLEKTIEEHNIANAKLIDNLPRDEYEQITKECDIGLIILDPKFTIPNYPSRILSYMEYSKPVLAATDNVTDIKELIEDANCGSWIWSGDEDEFIEEIIKMSKQKNLNELGINGRKYIEKNFTVSSSVKLLEKHFM